MNRHLKNTLSALSASGALLVLGLIAASPLMPPDTGAAQQPLLATAAGVQSAPAVESSSGTSAVAMLSTAIDQASTHNIDAASPNRASGTQRQRRQTLVMPYLSFLPRG